VGLFNYSVDPYVVYHYAAADADRLSRIEQFDYMRVTKPWYVRQLSPRRIVMGTSTSARIPPQPVWPADGSYNLSIPGLTPFEMLRFLEHANAYGPVEKLTLGLDFAAFIRPLPVTQPGFEARRLASTGNGPGTWSYRWQQIEDMADTLFSLPAFNLSLAALARSMEVRQRYFKDGSWETVSDRYVGKSGFTLVGKINIYAYRDAPAGLDENMALFAEILRFAHRNDVETRIIVTPMHVFMLDLWYRVGYQQWWRRFHSGLVEVNEEVAMELGEEPFPIYGFNHVRGVVDEPIRPAADARRSVFDDGVHFRKSFGGRMMGAVWGDDPGIGYALDPESVAPYLAEVDRMRQGFEDINRKQTGSMRSSIFPGTTQRPEGVQ